MKKWNVFAIVLAGMVLAGCGSSDAAMAVYSTGTTADSSSRGVAEASVEYDYEEATASSAAADYYDGADLDSEYLIDDNTVSAGTGGGVSASGADEGSSSTNDEGVRAVDTSKKIVYNLTYSVETTDLDALDAAIQAKVNALGGYIEYMSADGNEYSDPYYGTSSSNGTSRRYAYYTIRIPVAHLDEFAESVEEGSNVTSRSKSTQDITTSYIDTDSKRKSLEEELEILDNMMKKAETVEDMIQIEAQRTEVRADLENIASQLKSMDERVNYSTVDINVTEVTVLTDTTGKDLSWQERIANGFTTSCENLIETTQEILIWIASNIPMIIFWIIVLIIGLVLLRLVLILAGAILGIKRRKKDKKNGEGRICNDNRQTERRQVDADEHADRTEDRDHVVQAADDKESD